MNPLRKYVLVAYGVPAIVIAVSAGGWFDGYGTDEYCWLSRTGDRVIWAFIGPAAAIIAVNLVFFVRTVTAIWRMPVHTSGSGKHATVGRFRRAIKASLSFFAVMGIGWVFGILSMIPGASVVFQYLFALANALQGVLIFLFHCWLDTHVHSALYRWQKGAGADYSGSSGGTASSSSTGSSRKAIDKAVVTSTDRVLAGSQAVCWVLSALGLALMIVGFVRINDPANGLAPSFPRKKKEGNG